MVPEPVSATDPLEQAERDRHQIADLLDSLEDAATNLRRCAVELLADGRACSDAARDYDAAVNMVIRISERLEAARSGT